MLIGHLGFVDQGLAFSVVDVNLTFFEGVLSIFIGDLHTKLNLVKDTKLKVIVESN